MNLMKVKQVAELLDTSERTIHNKIKNNQLPVIRIAGLVRIDGNKLQELLTKERSSQSDRKLANADGQKRHARAS